MIPHTYLTLKTASEGTYKEKGSKFLAFAFPVSSEQEIRDRMMGLKKRFHDARHHCYAYILGPERKIFRANDDGEPNHSAGDPILGQIRSRELTNTLVVVVRYFGGTKLGVGGLIHAYRTAAELALDNSETVEKKVTAAFTLKFGYEHTSEIMKLVKDLNLKVVHQEFTDVCRMRIEVGLRDKERLLNRVDLLNQTRIKVDLLTFEN